MIPPDFLDDDKPEPIPFPMFGIEDVPGELRSIDAIILLFSNIATPELWREVMDEPYAHYHERIEDEFE